LRAGLPDGATVGVTVVVEEVLMVFLSIWFSAS
jgi:hypothetical protein